MLIEIIEGLPIRVLRDLRSDLDPEYGWVKAQSNVYRFRGTSFNRSGVSGLGMSQGQRWILAPSD
jgi:hypothetical protein